MRNVSDDYENLRCEEEGPARFNSEDLDQDLLNSANSFNDDSGKVPEISINDVLLDSSKIMIEASPPVAAESPSLSSQEEMLSSQNPKSLMLKQMSTIKEFPENEDGYGDEEESRIIDSPIKEEQTGHEDQLMAQLKELKEEKLALEA